MQVRKWMAAIVVSMLFLNLPAYSEDLSEYYGFDEMEIIKLNWGIMGLQICDFNGDKRNDIAVVNNLKARIEILLQKEEIGMDDGEFVDFRDKDINLISGPSRFKRESVAVSQKVSSFVCGDLNSDGMLDLAFYGTPEGLYIILQKKGESKKQDSLSWRSRKKIKIDDGLLNNNALVCADLNNDGKDDLALAGRNAVYIILQKKNGTLAEPVKYPTSVRTLAIKVADLNGDKINDMVLITNDSEKRVHVRFGLMTGQLGPQERFFIEQPWSLKFSDIDGDPGDEILTVDAVSGRLGCYKFATEDDESGDWPMLYYRLASVQGSQMRDMVICDVDGDKLDDVVISEPGSAELILYKQHADIGLVEPVRFPGLADIKSLSAADIDKDGKSEIAVLSVKEKTLGISGFENDRLSFPATIETVDEPIAMELTDIDGDGGIDCLYISKDANDVRKMRVIYTVAAAGRAGAKLTKKEKRRLKIKGKVGQTAAPLVIDKLTSNPEGLHVLDIDQDGLQDVMLFVKYESPIVIRQTAKRIFEVVEPEGTQASLIKEANLSAIAAANVDGENGAELLVAQKNFARSLVFSEREGWRVIDQYNARGTENHISAVAAFNIETDSWKGTGLPAILLLDGQKSSLQLLKSGEDKTYRFEKELDVGNWGSATHLKIRYASLTGGKSKSILLFDTEKFAIITVPDRDNVSHHLGLLFNYETKIKDGIYGNLAAGDINHNGKSDIVMVEYKNNHIEILALDAENKPTVAMRFKLFEKKSFRNKKGKASVEPRELKIIDVTSDGKNDLVTVIHDRIIIYPQD